MVVVEYWIGSGHCLSLSGLPEFGGFARIERSMRDCSTICQSDFAEFGARPCRACSFGRAVLSVLAGRMRALNSGGRATRCYCWRCLGHIALRITRLSVFLHRFLQGSYIGFPVLSSISPTVFFTAAKTLAPMDCRNTAASSSDFRFLMAVAICSTVSYAMQPTTNMARACKAGEIARSPFS